MYFLSSQFPYQAFLLFSFHHRRLRSREILSLPSPSPFQRDSAVAVSSASMAPRKRKTPEAEGGSKAEEKPAVDRVTRRSARLAQTDQALPLASQPAPEKTKPPRKKATKTAVVEEAKEQLKEKSENGKTVVIEHCKQCNQFKVRALKVKDGLEKGISGITVLVNPEKPRRGCFEIREEDGETFISLLDMKRPFGPMKALDMDQVITDIVDKLSG